MLPVSHQDNTIYVCKGSIEYYDPQAEQSMTLTMEDIWDMMYFSLKTTGEMLFDSKEELMAIVDDFYERFKDIPNTIKDEPK